MLVQFFIGFKRELKSRIEEIAMSNGSVLQKDKSNYDFNVGKVQGMEEALRMYEEYLRRLSNEDDIPNDE